jgi:hypothetical protein
LSATIAVVALLLETALWHHFFIPELNA